MKDFQDPYLERLVECVLNEHQMHIADSWLTACPVTYIYNQYASHLWRNVIVALKRLCYVTVIMHSHLVKRVLP